MSRTPAPEPQAPTLIIPAGLKIEIDPEGQLRAHELVRQQLAGERKGVRDQAGTVAAGAR